MPTSHNIPATCAALPGEFLPLSAPPTEPWLARSSLTLVILAFGSLALGSGCAGDEFTACKGDDCAHTAAGGASAGSDGEGADGSGGSDGSAGAGNSDGGGSGGEAGADGSSTGTGGEGGLGGSSITGTGGATATNASGGGGQTAGSGGSSTGGSSTGGSSTGGSSTGGSGMGPASTSASGSRLKRRTLDAGDGATMVLDFWDTELDVPCGFDEAAGSTLGCIIHNSLMGDATFADPACSQPVYGGEDQTCNSGWMRARASGNVYRATTTAVTLEENDGYFFETSGGDCSEVTLTPSGNYYEAELVPSSSFVGGVIETEERQDGLVTRYAVGDDGSRILVGSWFEARDYQCAFDERGYCLPVDRIQPEASYFEDAACSKEVFGFSGGEPPMISRKSSSDHCSDLEFYERGEEITAGALYRLDSSGTCVQETPAYSFYDFFELGSKISLSTIPKAQREAEGTGSLVARRWVDSAGDPLTEVDEFWDTTHDEACTPYATASGAYVCVPKNYADVGGNEHLDASCADIDQFAYALCPPETPRVAVRFGQRSCDLANMVTVEVAYGVGAPLGVDYFENDLNCDPGSLSDVYSAYEAGESLLEDLPVLVFVVDE